MSTSSSPAPLPRKRTVISPFAYGEIVETTQVKSGVQGSISQMVSEAECARREVVAREAGRKLGRSDAQSEGSEETQKIQESVAHTLTEFASERSRFYRAVEEEIVNLSLSIARKILHREAQIDPLLMAGMVRVVLEKIEAQTKVVIRVNPVRATDWRSSLASPAGSLGQIEVVEDGEVEQYGCLIQTSVGDVKVGLNVQLKEIEQGLLDLLAHRPTEKNER
jgi:flagellar assembly protein FliH